MQQVFGQTDDEHEHEHNTHWDQEVIRAVSTDPAVLKASLEYLDKLIKEYQKQNDRARGCSICLEPYSALAFKGKIPEGGSDMPQPQNKKKIGITYCDENHTMCVACCNNPSIEACPSCRASIDINTKIGACQKCTSASTDLRFIHCKDCDAIGVLCEECTQVPCCRKEIEASDTLDKTSVRNHVDTIIKKLEDKHAEFVAHENALCMQNLSGIALARQQEEKKLGQSVSTLVQQIERLNANIKVSDEKLKSHVARYLMPSTYNWALILDYNNQVNAHNALIKERLEIVSQFEIIKAEMNQRHQHYQRKIAQINRVFNGRVHEERKSLEKLKDTLNGMV